MNSVPAVRRSPDPAVPAPAHRPTRSDIARIDQFDSFETAGLAWERLLAAGAVATPFSDMRWLAAWQDHVGEAQGCKPLIAVGRDDHDAPLFILPLALKRGRTLTTARFFGSTHSHLNMGLWRRDIADAMTAERLRTILAELARKNGIDLFTLRNQPYGWDGCENPLARLPLARVADDVYRLDFHGRGGEQVITARLKPNMRGVLRNKERKLQKLSGYRYFRASTVAEVERVLEAFFAQKAAHFADQGLRNVFAAPGVGAFLRAACMSGLAEGRPAIELHALEGGGEVIAVLGGVAGRQRFAAMFNSYTRSENSRWSPGLIIVTHVIRDCADRGLDSFDLGVGYADYKWFFCKDVDPLFDSFLPFSVPGQAAALACYSSLGLKRWIKATPPVWNAVQRLRRMLA
jgi:CelD/BcsL family acetyltransferase involved in cellulose biosynthesis